LTISDEILFALKGGSDNWLLVSESYLYALNKDENGIAPKKLITYPIIAWDDIKCLKINKVKKGYHDNIEVWVNDQKYYETGIVCSFIDEMNSLFSVVLSSLDSIAECDIEAVSRINTNYTDFEHELARTDKFVVLFLTNKPEIKFQEDYVYHPLTAACITNASFLFIR
jgi:predicted transglutaminase-like protease